MKMSVAFGSKNIRYKNLNGWGCSHIRDPKMALKHPSDWWKNGFRNLLYLKLIHNSQIFFSIKIFNNVFFISFLSVFCFSFYMVGIHLRHLLVRGSKTKINELSWYLTLQSMREFYPRQDSFMVCFKVFNLIRVEVCMGGGN